MFCEFSCLGWFFGILLNLLFNLVFGSRDWDLPVVGWRWVVCGWFWFWMYCCCGCVVGFVILVQLVFLGFWLF